MFSDLYLLCSESPKQNKGKNRNKNLQLLSTSFQHSDPAGCHILHGKTWQDILYFGVRWDPRGSEWLEISLLVINYAINVVDGDMVFANEVNALLMKCPGREEGRLSHLWLPIHDIIHLLAYRSLWPADVSIITLKFPALMFHNERARNNPTDIPARFWVMRIIVVSSSVTLIILVWQIWLLLVLTFNICETEPASSTGRGKTVIANHNHDVTSFLVAARSRSTLIWIFPAGSLN